MGVDRPASDAANRQESPTLYPFQGCGRCADIVAASLLTGDPQFYDMLALHQEGHEFQPSIWPDVNERGAAVSHA